MAYVLSLDFGTGGARAGVFDLDRAQLVAAGEAAYSTHHRPPDRAEQDPEDWWAAACRIVPSVLKQAGQPRIAAVCVATFASTVVISDAQGQPIYPAILWMDARAADEARETESCDHPVMEYCGGGDAAEWLVPKAMWLKRNAPDIYHRAEVIGEALDFINYRLCGQWVGSVMNATCKWNWDSRSRGFVPEIFAQFDTAELSEKLPNRIVDIGDVIGEMTTSACGALGISGRPVVVQGGIDAHMGAFGADTIMPGSMLLIGGTSNVHLTQIPDDGHTVSGVWGPYPDALTPGLRLIEGGQVSAGSILNWLARDIYGLDDPGFSALCEEAEAIDFRSTGLLALDFWMGNRTPYRDAKLRGAMLGLSLSHDRASIFRACVTSVALGAANVVTALEQQGVGINQMVVAGGMLRNRMWLDATIDAIGKPARVVKGDNLSLYGTAIAGSVGLGRFPSMQAAAGSIVPPCEQHDPDPTRHAAYQSLLTDYREAVDLLTPILNRLAKHEGTA